MWVLLLGLCFVFTDGFTATETVQMKMQCRKICSASKAVFECETVCREALEHRIRNFPQLPEQLKHLRDAITISSEPKTEKHVVSQQFVKPGRGNNILRR